jgi:hypothetical protein
VVKSVVVITDGGRAQRECSRHLHLASGTIEADSKENATTSVSQDEEQTTVSSQGYLTITAVPTKPPPAMLIHVCILPERYIPIVCYTRYPLFEPSRDIDRY